MPEPRITLEQLKLLGIRAVSRAKQLPPPGKVVLIRTPEGQIFHVTGVRLSNRGHYAILGDGQESVLLRKPSKFARAVRLTAIMGGLVVSLSALISLLAPYPAPQVQRRLEQLATIQGSLRELDGYIDEQRATLQHLSDDLDKLQRERATLSEVAKLDRQQVEALLEYQASSQRKREWLSIGLSFIVGILSSVAATLLLRILRRRKQEQEVITASDN